VYPAVTGVAQGVFRALGLRITVEGAGRVPRSGPVVLASNHVSFLDFLLMGLVARPSRRRVRFLTRREVFSAPLVRPLMADMRHVPVDREAPAAAYLRARALLRQGEAVGIFPEAGVSTSYTVRALMPGAAALAAATGAPLLPVAVWGPQRVLTAHRPVDLHRGRPVSLLVGEALHVPAGEDPRLATERLGGRLQELLDQLQARPRHRPAAGEVAPWHPAHLGGQAPTPAQARPLESVPRSAVPPTWWAG